MSLTSEQRSVNQPGRLQDDDGEVRVELPGWIVSTQRQEDRRAPSGDHRDPADLERGELPFRLETSHPQSLSGAELTLMTEATST